MKPCPGVYIEDMGFKIALNGVDNGRIKFDNVRVKREALLNAFNDVTSDGRFISDIKKPSARFFRVADSLLSGRLCIASLCMTGSKLALNYTIKYSQQRLAVG
jgi:acyl-CoA oxidase